MEAELVFLRATITHKSITTKMMIRTEMQVGNRTLMLKYNSSAAVAEASLPDRMLLKVVSA
jgi:hypothetical protein